MKSSQSNFDLRSPSSYLARSYLIATVSMIVIFPLSIPSRVILVVLGLSTLYFIKCLPAQGITVTYLLKALMFDHNFIFVVDLTETFNFTHSETMHEIDHEEVFIIAKPICQQMDNRSKKQDAWLTNGSVGAMYTYLHRVVLCMYAFQNA